MLLENRSEFPHRLVNPEGCSRVGGSALYDIASGEVIGIINMAFVKGSKESAMTQPSGICFAMPVRYLAELMRTAR